MLRLIAFGGLALTRDGQMLSGAATRRRPLALLALLASAGERGLSRDKAVGYFWPEGETERSRHALAQTLYSIRHDLSPDVLMAGASDLRLNAGAMEADFWEFEQAIGAGQLERAASLYAGPFLDGFYVSDAPAFERWVEDERTRYAHRYRSVLENLAKHATSAGDVRAAAEWWRRVVTADPLDGRAALAYMKALADAGDAAAAVRHARIHEMLVRQELKLAPDEAVRAFARELRDRAERPAVVKNQMPRPPVPSAREGGEAVAVTVPASQEVAQYRSTPLRMLSPEAVASGSQRAPIGVEGSTSPVPPEHRGSRRLRLIASAVVVALLGLSFVAWQTIRTPTAPVVLAVGNIREFGASDSLGMVPALGEMLSTNVARIPGWRVISNARIYDLARRGAPTQSLEERIEQAAREAGAAELVEGSLYVQPGRPMRLDLRRVEIASGAVRDAYTVQGRDLFALVDSATAHLAHDYAPRGEVLRIADVTTTSLIAHRFYDEGLRELYERSNGKAALRLFQLALREDSTFAMAGYYVYAVGTGEGDSSGIDGAIQALRWAGRTSEHQRLLINAGVRVRLNDPKGVIYAESLATRYPNEPDGLIDWAYAKVEGGDFMGAVPLLRRVVAADSFSLRRENARKGAPCEACIAYGDLMEAYWRADSMAASERVAREYLARQPWSGFAAERLATALTNEHRFAEAEREFNRASDSTNGALFDPLRRADFYMRAGRLTEADQILEAMVAGHDDRAPERGGALWWLWIERRAEGRLRDAERITRRLIALYPSNFEIYQAYGQSLIDEGRYREAAHVFDSLATRPPFPPDIPWKNARQATWFRTHLVTALAAAGDTARVRRLADSLQYWGAQSAYGRDRLMHHYARALVLRAEHKDDEAIDEFRRAIYSPTLGYTRINYELGHLLLAHGRAAEAVAIVRPALFGSLEASNAYITHTELHELLAQAFDSLRQPDSAAVHYRLVVDAWSHADPQLHARYQKALSHLSSSGLLHGQ